jgi:putative ABC transport system permease protein
VLLAAALLFGRTLKNLMVQDLGMHIDGVTISYVDMSRLNLPLERRAVFKRTIMRQLEQTPGVISVAETSLVPLSGGASFFMNTSAGYFKTMATPLLAGRRFDDRDTPQSPLVAVVNEAFARKFFAGNSPCRQAFLAGSSGRPDVVHDHAKPPPVRRNLDAPSPGNEDGDETGWDHSP